MKVCWKDRDVSKGIGDRIQGCCAVVNSIKQKAEDVHVYLQDKRRDYDKKNPTTIEDDQY